jgi:hypothetical protein
MKLKATEYTYRASSYDGIEELTIQVPSNGDDWTWQYEARYVAPVRPPEVSTEGLTVRTRHVTTEKSTVNGDTITRYGGCAFGPRLTLETLVTMFIQI